MSDTEVPLLHDEEDVGTPFITQDSATFQKYRRDRNVPKIFTACLLILLFAIFLILYLPWHALFQESKTILSTSSILAGPKRDLKFALHPEDHVSRDAGIRQFSWNITKGIIAPDGVEKNVYLINGLFPGPTVEARSGDILEIEVLNFSEEGISLHWHGLHMRGANHMDGPVGITQDAIKPGQRCAYRIPTDEQTGTFWYHAHSEVQRGDGLYGGLVIHNPVVSEAIPYQYDEELLFLIGDWYHWPSDKVLATFQSRTSMGNEPCPDSLLINGLGYFDCSMATPGAPVNCSEIEKPWLSLDKKKRYRIRLVNVGSLTGISFTVPDSEMKAIQVDGGQGIISEVANSIGVLYPAERVDILISWPGPAVSTGSEFIIELDNEYFLRPNFALTPTQTFPISPSTTLRTPSPQQAKPHRINLQKVKGQRLPTPLPEAGKKFMIYTTISMLERQGSIPQGFINRTTWKEPAVPLLGSPRESWDAHQLVPWTGSEAVWVELTINNIDNSGHPFHLHGFDFYVVSSYEGKGGWDYYNPFDSRPPRGGPFNLIDPVMKDTVYVPPWGYVVIRFLADNEGIWLLHCHVLWHQSSGMAMAFEVLGDGDQSGLGGGKGG